MWIFTTIGFFSAVCARKGDGSLKNDPDPARMMIRARVYEHLETLKIAFPDELADYEIKVSPTNDYRARIFMPKKVWAKILWDLTQETDYDNFKDACHRDEWKRDDPVNYHTWLTQVWGIGKRVQDDLYFPLTTKHLGKKPTKKKKAKKRKKR